jgi:hypothetical protein
MSAPSSRLCLRDRVVGAIIAAGIPIADAHVPRSGLAVSPNGRVVRLATFASDGGMGRSTKIWKDYFTLTIDILEEEGLIVRVTDPFLSMEVSIPALETASREAPTVRQEVA